MSDLKPVRCGCGGEMLTETLGNPVFGWRLRCPKWHIMTSWFDSEAEAVEAWNKAIGAKDINVRSKGEWLEKEVFDTKGQIEQWQSAKCSVCGKYHTTPYLYYFDNYHFCPNCGADMRGDHE